MQEKLTFREQEIFDLLLEGIPPKEIAFKINVSYSTVDYHRTRLYGKLGVRNIQELFAKYSTNSAPPIESAEPFPVSETKKRTIFRLMLSAGIAALAVSMFFAGYFFAKLTLAKPPLLNPSDDKPLTINLSDNAPHGWNIHLIPSELYDKQITRGDIYTFTYSFSSDTDFGALDVFFNDLEAFDATGKVHILCGPRKIMTNVKANTEYSGEVTIIINETAYSINPHANLLEILAKPYVPGQQPPTLTFTKFEFVKIN